MPLGTKVGLGPGNIVLYGDPAPRKGHSPQFSADVYCGHTVTHLSYRYCCAEHLFSVVTENIFSSVNKMMLTSLRGYV